MKEKNLKVAAFIKKQFSLVSDFIKKHYFAVATAIGLLAALATLFAPDGKTNAHFIFKELFSERKTYLSNFELDVLNEWVIPVEISESKADLLLEKELLQDNLKKSKYTKEDCYTSEHGCWYDNIFIVRNPEIKNSWMLVIDRLNGISSKEETQLQIDDINMWFKSSYTGARDTLETFFKGKEAYFYREEYFSKTYGVILNKPSNKNTPSKLLKNNTNCSSIYPISLEEPGWNKQVKESLEELICKNRHQHKKVVFDFDNTLVAGDIGEATFNQIVLDHRLDKYEILSRTLGEFYLDEDIDCDVEDSYGLISYYEKLLCITDREGENEPHANGYAWVVQAMAGMTPGEIINYTKTAYEGKYTGYYQKPSFYPEMVELIKVLIENEYKIYIISASNTWTVRFMVKEYLNKELQSRYDPQNDDSINMEIPLDHVFGINVLLKEKSTGKVFKDQHLISENKKYLEMDDAELSKYELTSSITYPLSAYHGKVATILKSISSSGKIFMAAGDSPNDFPMLNFSENKLWVARLEKPGYQENIRSNSSWFIQPTLYKKDSGFIPSAKVLKYKMDSYTDTESLETLKTLENIRKSINTLNDKDVLGNEYSADFFTVQNFD